MKKVQTEQTTLGSPPEVTGTSRSDPKPQFVALIELGTIRGETTRDTTPDMEEDDNTKSYLPGSGRNGQVARSAMQAIGGLIPLLPPSMRSCCVRY